MGIGQCFLDYPVLSYVHEAFVLFLLLLHLIHHITQICILVPHPRHFLFYWGMLLCNYWLVITSQFKYTPWNNIPNQQFLRTRTIFFTLFLQFFQYFRCSHVLCQIVNDWNVALVIWLVRLSAFCTPSNHTSFGRLTQDNLLFVQSICSLSGYSQSIPLSTGSFNTTQVIPPSLWVWTGMPNLRYQDL